VHSLTIVQQLSAVSKIVQVSKCMSLAGCLSATVLGLLASIVEVQQYVYACTSKQGLLIGRRLGGWWMAAWGLVDGRMHATHKGSSLPPVKGKARGVGCLLKLPLLTSRHVEFLRASLG
jgi:hypothetical protein